MRTGKDYMFGDIEETYGEGVWIGRVHLPHPEVDHHKAAISDLKHIKSLQTGFETKLEFVANRGKTKLIVRNADSVIEYDVQTSQQRRIAVGKTSVEMSAISEDSSTLLAFRDFQHVWLCPDLRALGKAGSLDAIWSKPGDAQTPRNLIRLSQDGGHDVALSSNRKRVFWLHGPRLYSADVARILEACQEASLPDRDSGACARSAISHHYLNVTFPSIQGQEKAASNDRAFAIVNASLISMDPTKPKMLVDATIITKRGQIIGVGSGNKTPLPEKVQILDVHGGAVLPGFVDVHGHWGGFLSPYPLHSWEMETFLEYGVTTIHNPASKNVAGMVERCLIEKGRMYGPRVFHTGDVLYDSTQPPVYTEIHSNADAKSALLRVKTEGGMHPSP